MSLEGPIPRSAASARIRIQTRIGSATSIATRSSPLGLSRDVLAIVRTS